jgi:hypothetical protein
MKLLIIFLIVLSMKSVCSVNRLSTFSPLLIEFNVTKIVYIYNSEFFDIIFARDITEAKRTIKEFENVEVSIYSLDQFILMFNNSTAETVSANNLPIVTSEWNLKVKQGYSYDEWNVVYCKLIENQDSIDTTEKIVFFFDSMELLVTVSQI